MNRTRLFTVLLIATSCGPLLITHTPNDGGMSATGGGEGSTVGGGTGGSSGTGGGGGGTTSSTVHPAEPCEPFVLECLDPASPTVLEVPTEMTLQAAITNAQANDVIQIKGAALASGWRIPSYVTLRGCAGASIKGTVAFVGGGGIVEGFEVTGVGSVIANLTGSYVVRHNRFTGDSTSTLAGVSARSIDGLVSASVSVIVENNIFSGRATGLEANTRYDTMTHQVDFTARNNVFNGVAKPISVVESGLVGVVTAKIEHNTFYDFVTAIDLFAVDRMTRTSSNLFVKGNTAIRGAQFEVNTSLASEITTPTNPTIPTGAPEFVDAAAGDFRLKSTSAALDRVPNNVVVPSEDFQGCPRPAGAPGEPPKADIGAFESQP